MSVKLEIISFDDAEGVILPTEVLKKLGVKEGDAVYLSETPMGFELTSASPEVQLQMKIAERIMREDYNLLRRLAREDTRPHPDLPQA